MDARRVILTGATGMVGGHALEFCLANDEVTEVTVVGRRSVGIQNSKLTERTHSDYADYKAIGDAFNNQDIALFCIGVYTGAVPDDEFRKITVDYTVAFAEAILSGGRRFRGVRRGAFFPEPQRDVLLPERRRS